MRTTIWWNFRLPATWAYLALMSITVVASAGSVAISSDSAWEQAFNTARAVVLYAGPIWLATTWGRMADADVETVRYLTGVSVRSQRAAQAQFAFAFLTVSALVSTSITVATTAVVAPDVAVDSQDNALNAAIYCWGTVLVVTCLTTVLCADRRTLVAVPTALLVPLIHTLAYFSVDLPGRELWQAVWPSTAVGVLIRGKSEASAAIGLVAVASIAVVVVLASKALTPRAGKRAHVSFRWTPRPRNIGILVCALAVAGSLPTVASQYLPYAYRPSTWLDTADGRAPDQIAHGYFSAVWQGDMQQQQSAVRHGAAQTVLRQVPIELRSRPNSSTFEVVRSTDLESADVVATLGRSAIHVCMRADDGWKVRSVQEASCR